MTPDDDDDGGGVIDSLARRLARFRPTYGRGKGNIAG